jgi:hypothetical protein
MNVNVRILSALAAITLCLLTSCGDEMPDSSPDRITGMVSDSHGPLTGAVVRVQATENSTITDVAGRFTLFGLAPGETVLVTAWAMGYYIGGVEALPGESVEITLHAHTAEDNPDYQWLPSQFYSGQGENQGCAECHSTTNTDLNFMLPVDEWLLDAHSQSAANQRFLTMYTGQDVFGNQSPLTRYAYTRGYGSFPLRPDPSKPNYGPGYQLDFPDSAGNCAACHAPLAAVDNAYGVDPTSLTGVALEGISCDFCHKIWDVHLDPDTGLPYANMPGVLSYSFRRPPDGHQFFGGPLDDVAPGEDTFVPIYRQSEYCAPCHFAIFWDTVVYNSFGEWMESSYSDPETGQTCQDCHMPPLGVRQFATTEAGGLERDPATIFSHRMPGAADEKLLQNALTMNVKAHCNDNRVVVEIELVNDKTGHSIPTDSPLRHLILLVEVTDENGENLDQLEGPTIPAWGGIGDYEEGYYAGVPGTAYAKILQELWTEVSPTGSYWNPTSILSDNRIPAMGSDKTMYTFQTRETLKTAKVSVTLLYRRAFIEIMDQKGWEVPDIVMEKETIELP